MRRKIRNAKLFLLSSIIALSVCITACGTPASDADTDSTANILGVEEPSATVVENVTEPEEPQPPEIELIPPALSEVLSERDGYLIFGSYEQDANLENGLEPIEWIKLEENEHGMLLLSRYILDAHPYNNSYQDITWELSDLREWLNNDFYNTAFSPEEQLFIAQTTVHNADNERYGTPGGSDTQDHIFLLSANELLQYYRFNTYHEKYKYGYSEQLIIEPTQYAIQVGVKAGVISAEDHLYLYDGYGYTTGCIGRIGACWWLRSPGFMESDACCVDANGCAGWGNVSYVNYSYYGIRPALYIAEP